MEWRREDTWYLSGIVVAALLIAYLVAANFGLVPAAVPGVGGRPAAQRQVIELVDAIHIQAPQPTAVIPETAPIVVPDAPPPALAPAAPPVGAAAQPTPSPSPAPAPPGLVTTMVNTLTATVAGVLTPVLGLAGGLLR